MKIAICDDEAAVSDVTKSLLQQWAIHQSISLSVHCYETGDALTLMRSKSLQYLLKPVSPNQLWSIMDDFIALIKNQKEIFVARTSDGFCKITLEDTNYYPSSKQIRSRFSFIMVQVSKSANYFPGAKKFLLWKQGFFRCHRSYIINLNFVNRFTKNSVTMTGMVPHCRSHATGSSHLRNLILPTCLSKRASPVN